MVLNNSVGGPPYQPSLNVRSKRKRFAPVTLVDNDECDRVPRFLVVTRVDGESFYNVNPFVISDAIENSAGEVEFMRKLRNGSILIKTKTEAQSKLILSMTAVGPHGIKVSSHGSLNFSKGIIFQRDLTTATDEELKSKLEKRGVVDVRRLKRRVGDQLVDTGAFILTFNALELPEKIKVAMYHLTVRPYIPAPMRCYKCQRFGHTSQRCQGVSTCGNCGKKEHEGQDCKPPPVCVNCEGQHAPKSKTCPIFQKEKLIQEIKTKEKISYPEARRKVNIMAPPQFSVSFAQKVAATPLPKKQLLNPILPSPVQKSSIRMNSPKKNCSQQPRNEPFASVATKDKTVDSEVDPTQVAGKTSPPVSPGKNSPSKEGLNSSPNRGGSTPTTLPTKAQEPAEKRERSRKPLSRLTLVAKERPPSPGQTRRDDTTKHSSTEHSPPSHQVPDDIMEIEDDPSVTADEWMKVGGKKKGAKNL